MDNGLVKQLEEIMENYFTEFSEDTEHEVLSLLNVYSSVVEGGEDEEERESLIEYLETEAISRGIQDAYMAYPKYLVVKMLKQRLDSLEKYYLEDIERNG